MWYHDHAEDITAHNALMGLAGFFFLRDAEEERWRDEQGLPDRDHEIPLARSRMYAFARSRIPISFNRRLGTKSRSWRIAAHESSSEKLGSTLILSTTTGRLETCNWSMGLRIPNTLSVQKRTGSEC